MFRALVICSLLGGCFELNEPTPQDPRCPKNWDFDLTMDGQCRPPDGYTALLFAEFGGSGIYGFARTNTICGGADDETCGPEMLGDLAIELYLPDDVVNHTIRVGAIPVAASQTSQAGVYKMQAEPGEYVITCTDPFDDGLVTGGAEVKTDAVALYAIDLDHRR
ncbi:MAG: hypothetical protein H0T79_19320 [Deltaproteobacteria bacterium]|nr:hypothetical protein [Deltaproteobacteria bacterium]